MKTKRTPKRPPAKWLALFGLLSALIVGGWLWIRAKAKSAGTTNTGTTNTGTATAATGSTAEAAAKTKAAATTVASTFNNNTYVPTNKEFSEYEFDSGFA